MRCWKTKRWLDRYVDGEAPAALRQDLESHLAGCDACAAEWKLRRELAAKLRAALESLPDFTEKDPSYGLELRMRLPKSERSSVQLKWRWSVPVGLAAAAAALVVVLAWLWTASPSPAPSGNSGVARTADGHGPEAPLGTGPRKANDGRERTTTPAGLRVVPVGVERHSTDGSSSTRPERKRDEEELIEF